LLGRWSESMQQRFMEAMKHLRSYLQKLKRHLHFQYIILKVLPKIYAILLIISLLPRLHADKRLTDSTPDKIEIFQLYYIELTSALLIGELINLNMYLEQFLSLKLYLQLLFLLKTF
jgi:hypothetical protein